MSVFLMGLAIFAVVLITFVLILGITKGVALMANANKKGPIHSPWVPLQVCSGDDSLGHPDLEKISELRENKLMEGVESI